MKQTYFMAMSLLVALSLTSCKDNMVVYPINQPVVEPEEVTYNKIQIRADNDPLGPLYMADRNVGATSVSHPGMYFYWSDLNGLYYQNGAFYDANMSPAKDNKGNIISVPNWFFPSNDYVKEHCSYYKTREQLVEDKKIDKNFNLVDRYDAAAKYMGDDWRLINEEDGNWISENCTFEKVVVDNDVQGYYLIPKDKTLSHNRVYFPATGGISSLFYDSQYAFSWGATASVDGTYAGYLFFDFYNFGWDAFHDRCSGLPIRGVSDVK